MFALIRRLYPGDGILRELVHQTLGDGGESTEDIAIVDLAVALYGLAATLETLHIQKTLVGHVHERQSPRSTAPTGHRNTPGRLQPPGTLLDLGLDGLP